jgi:hypothetical protein
VALADLGFYGGSQDLGDDARWRTSSPSCKRTSRREPEGRSDDVEHRRPAQLLQLGLAFGLIFILVDLGRAAKAGSSLTSCC